MKLFTSQKFYNFSDRSLLSSLQKWSGADCTGSHLLIEWPTPAYLVRQYSEAKRGNILVRIHFNWVHQFDLYPFVPYYKSANLGCYFRLLSCQQIDKIFHWCQGYHLRKIDFIYFYLTKWTWHLRNNTTGTDIVLQNFSLLSFLALYCSYIFFLEDVMKWKSHLYLKKSLSMKKVFLMIFYISFFLSIKF